KAGGVITVASDARDESDPSVAMDKDGKFIVTNTLEVSKGNFFAGTREDTDIMGHTFRADGTPKRSSFIVAGSLGLEAHSHVARALDTGVMTVVFEDRGVVKF